MNGKFVYGQSSHDDLWYFQLLSRNGRVLAVSKGYTTLASCMKGIYAVRRCAAKAELTPWEVE